MGQTPPKQLVLAIQYDEFCFNLKLFAPNYQQQILVDWVFPEDVTERRGSLLPHHNTLILDSVQKPLAPLYSDPHPVTSANVR